MANEIATGFDLPPINDPITKIRPDMLSDIWRGYLSILIDTLQNFLSQYGIFPPNLTMAQRDSIQSPQNGQMIFNTTADSMQYYKVSSGTWVSF